MDRSWPRNRRLGESAHPARVDHVHRNIGLAQPAGQQPFVAARWFTDGQGGVVLLKVFAQLGDACCGVVETQHRATGDRNVQVGLAHVNAGYHCHCCWRRVALRLRRGAGPGRAQGARSCAGLVWEAGHLKIYDRLLTVSLVSAGVAHDGHQMQAHRPVVRSSCPPWAPSRWLVSVHGDCGNFPGTGPRK